MKIKIIFDQLEYISVGQNRDMLKVTIIKPDWFVSQENALSIEKDSSETAKVPKMMPDNDFTRELLELTELIK